MFSLVSIFYKETFRNGFEVFFTLLLPVLILLLFGIVFGLEIDQSVEYKLGIAGNYEEGIVEDLPYQVLFFEDKNSLSQALESDQIDMGIIMVENNQITFVQTETDINNRSNIFLKLKLQSLLKKNFVGMNEDYINVEFVETTIGESQENTLDFILTGVIGLSLLSGGMFSMINVFGRYRKLGTIKRLKASPMKPIEFTLSASFTKLFLNLISMFIIVFLGKTIFDLSLTFNWGLLVIVFFTSSIGMMGFGILLLLLFKEPSVTIEIASILYVAMTFFSGVYFPVEFLPSSVRWVSNILPVKYVVDLIRYTGNIKQISLNAFVIINLVLFVEGLFLLFVSSEVFLKEEK
ncbi:MAG: ABC-2 type transporter [Petrotoga mobilis]|jgi:ABC-2 type transport system permease protein|nr:MAG: ABC-2 type transporter [Petrotoga mobilis]